MATLPWRGTVGLPEAVRGGVTANGRDKPGHDDVDGSWLVLADLIQQRQRVPGRELLRAAAQSFRPLTFNPSRIPHMKPMAIRRAYALADNKLALNARWDRGVLAVELQALADLQFDAEVTGFSCAEIELVLDTGSEGRGASDAKTPPCWESR
jgi:hypothetical protein